MPERRKRPTTEQIIEDAEIAAAYLRSLIEKGVPMMAAVSLTSSYISSFAIRDLGDDPPKEPWQEP
jgi:hypothetical protein